MKTKQELIDFETWTVDTFNAGKLKSPVHLSGGNEEQLIKIFKDIEPQDWVLTTYRSHYHALLKGVPEQRLKDWILDNKSIHFMDSEYKVFSSAIVGGTLPIALGVAMAIHRKGAIGNGYPTKYNSDLGEGLIGTKIQIPHVYCFIGDMTASLGVAKDCITYAINHELPITFVIEDNGLSTDTKTSDVWNYDVSHYTEYLAMVHEDYVRYYQYDRVYPHYGTNVFVKSLWEDILKKDKDDVRIKGF